MSLVSTALFTLACLSALYYVLSTLALLHHFRTTRNSKLITQNSKLSLLKPVCGVEMDSRFNFLTFLTQDYPDFEVIFGVLDDNDPSVAKIRDIINYFPNASFMIGSEIDGANNKVRILHNLALHATGDILVITDADTRVTPDFLREIIAPFEDNSVGVVTCMYRGIDAITVAEALEALHMTCIFAPGVACAEYLHHGIDFGLGAAIAIRKSVLDEIGGFASIADYLADDFHLGRKAAQAGHRVVLPNYVVDIALTGETWSNVLQRELRWSRTTRISRPRGHFGLIVTFGFTYAVLYWLASGFSATGWLTLFGVATIRAATAWIGAAKLLGDREFPKWAYLLPIRDLLSFGIWIAGYFSNTVTWRGRKLRVLTDGRIVFTRESKN